MIVHLNIRTARITEDTEHPVPWGWFLDHSTQWGSYNQEGLARTEEEALEEAQEKFKQWILDKRTQRKTTKYHRVEMEIDDES